MRRSKRRKQGVLSYHRTDSEPDGLETHSFPHVDAAIHLEFVYLWLVHPWEARAGGRACIAGWGHSGVISIVMETTFNSRARAARCIIENYGWSAERSIGKRLAGCGCAVSGSQSHRKHTDLSGSGPRCLRGGASRPRQANRTVLKSSPLGQLLDSEGCFSAPSGRGWPTRRADQPRPARKKGVAPGGRAHRPAFFPCPIVKMR
jgi:hypothetical protein